MKIVVALGGNSLIRYGQRGTYEEQIENMRATCRQLAQLVKLGHRLLIVHGNGPQVGNVLLQQECAKDVPQMPLYVCVAMTQGQIGFFIQNVLRSELQKAGIKNNNVVTLLTQAVVDANDPAFRKPTKPVGPFYKEKKFSDVIFVKDKGYRRVVPSPKPQRIVEEEIIKKLFFGRSPNVARGEAQDENEVFIGNGDIVVAGGGGGIPVMGENAGLAGREAVIDKDYCAGLLAKAVEADLFMCLTDVDGVAINFKKPNEKKIDRMSAREAEKYLGEGHFGEGSMKPKIDACLEFLKQGGKKCVISLPESALEAMSDGAGTKIQT